jgi:hypothetical protein
MKISYLQQIVICLAVILLVVNLCCKKSALPPGEVSVNAIVINEGDPAADGCGWLIKTATDTIFHPTNLSTKYQVDSLKIHINYHKLADKFECGGIPESLNGGIPEIQIDAISTQ